MNAPRVVSPAEWEQARQELLADEKAATRARDALAARRRRMPWVEVAGHHVFAGPEGPVTLLDLFAGRRQLVVYHFMWHGPEHVCEGCSMFVDNLGHAAHLHARDTHRVLMSTGPVDELLAHRERMGWTIPWVSARDTDLYAELGLGGGFALNVFVRDGDRVYRTYTTDGRGVELAGTNWGLLDLTPFGRQENWEDAPEGTPQGEPYGWWRLHDDYDKEDRPEHVAGLGLEGYRND